MSFNHEYTIQLRDTDAAGVVYFASILSICHLTYEASLCRSGIDLRFFVNNSDFAVPIVHVSADFFKPLYCGDRVNINLTPVRVDHYKFEIKYEIRSADCESEDRSQIFTTAISKHVVIDPHLRKRKELPAQLIDWLSRWS
jgi:1,4-dihydroxy-2-naphthoyl-CoA hydrolase